MNRTDTDSPVYTARIESPLGLLYGGCTAEGRIIHLHSRAPKESCLEQYHPSLGLLKHALREYFAGRPDACGELAVDLPQKGFAADVLNSLLSIPYGSTISYSQLAALAGQPKAVRAVASVVASNRLLILLPCHRVIHKDGRLGNYALGPELKQYLLDLERA